MQGIHHWKTMGDNFWNYVNHPESKFDGNIGILQRKHLQITSIVYIGKESNNLEDSEALGVNDGSYVRYQNNQIPVQKILDLKPKEAKKYGFSKTQLSRIKKSLICGKYNFQMKTLQKIMKIQRLKR